MKKIIECKIRDSLITVNFLSTYLKHELSNEPVYTQERYDQNKTW